jgi:hypothetical protein
VDGDLVSPEEQGNNRGESLKPIPPVHARFKPGQSGNPGGRPKGRSLTAILRDVLDGDELKGDKDADGKTIGHRLVEAMLTHAIDGDPSLIREILNRTEGRVPAKAEAMISTTVRIEYVNDWRGSASDDPPADAAPGAAVGLSVDEAIHMAGGWPSLEEDDACDGEDG